MNPTSEQLKARWLTEDGQKRLAAVKEALISRQEWNGILDGFDYTTNDFKRDLRGVDLSEADLSGANLSGADLYGAGLYEANLYRADLSGANLSEADLYRADLYEANLRKADFYGANLRDANLREADLRGANLSEADLSGADLSGADLSGANIKGADLSGANLSGADLSGAFLYGANLEKAILEQAILSGADLTGCQMMKANLHGADISGAKVFGTSVWAIEMDDQTKQDNLVITDYSESRITVDDIRVAQFIYLLLNNPNIRDVIDTIAKKVVLILGRFTEERKEVLEAIRQELRSRNYTPVLFDFEKPANRDITETVSILAHMSRFVIADLTDAKSIPQELMAIIPNLPSVAVQPLILKGQQEYAMFEHFNPYPWVLPIHEYDDQADLIANIGQMVVDPAEAKLKELIVRMINRG